VPVRAHLRCDVAPARSRTDPPVTDRTTDLDPGHHSNPGCEFAQPASPPCRRNASSTNHAASPPRTPPIRPDYRARLPNPSGNFRDPVKRGTSGRFAPRNPDRANLELRSGESRTCTREQVSAQRHHRELLPLRDVDNCAARIPSRWAERMGSCSPRANPRPDGSPSVPALGPGIALR
jgi:hypothetical protein